MERYTGRRVAVTRSREQASELGERLRALGAEVLELPLITIAKAVEEVAGAPAGSLATLLDEHGDLGRAVEDLLESERPLAGPALEAGSAFNSRST